MTPNASPVIEEDALIDADPDDVWRRVADPRAMSRWSPQVLRTRVTTQGPVGVGTRMRNLNRGGLLLWTTHAQVVRFDPGVEFAIKIRENRTVWSYRVEPVSSGTSRLAIRRETPDGVSRIALRLERLFWRSVPRFESRLRAGMRTTLSRIKRECERTAHARD
ncbi:SRPBCC family protein [Micromonospora sp. KC721]|uniref:SRPBCC family protein n=1 Tax=Micromonospora sp. KC721 TaxID=2530380 RepID=UPI001047A3AA|nr:SRPBCC family protein [Micromonospora sp. KC721]TDB74588.1 SRPBCC family protein [Micromonospora sp. KC721]